MLLVIIGAGASLDCVPGRYPDYQLDKPPLAADLFRGAAANKILNEVTVARAAVDAMTQEQDTGQRPVEEVLQEWRDEAVDSPLRRRMLHAMRFFLQCRLERASQWEAIKEVGWGITNYVKLVRHIDTWRERARESVVYVTFNYDTILDSALEDMALFELDDIQGYVADPSTRLIKVHGSSDWWHQVNIEVPVNRNPVEMMGPVIRKADDTNIEHGVEVVRNSLQFKANANRRAWLPAIAVPAIDKSEKEFECPQDHLDLLKESLPKVTRILVVGWRGQEQHFLDLMAESFMKVRSAAAVSQSVEGAESVLEHLWQNLMRGQMDFAPPCSWPYATFSTFVDSHPWEFLTYEPDDQSACTS